MIPRLAILLAVLTVPCALKAVERPNLVFILADDLGWSDTTLYGTTSFYETPNIERLARRGMLFTNAYTAHPLCSPTRCSIMTGLDPARTGFTSAAGHVANVVLEKKLPARARSDWKVLTPTSVSRLDTKYTTLAETIKAAGYVTGHFGKWHLGKEPYSPRQHGFDVDVPQWWGPGPAGSYLAPWRFPDSLDFDPRVPNEHIEDRMADEAVVFLEKNKDKPFFLNYWAFSVHAPFDGKQKLIEKYAAKADPKDPQRVPVYGAMVESLDDAVGQLIDTLDRLELSRKTIVVFFSDNGGNMYDRVDGLPPTSNAPLRGGKANIYEGGTRVPCAVVWPGQTKAGSRTDALLSSSDWYPTLLDIMRIEKPVDLQFDGVSQMATLLGQRGPRESLVCFVPNYFPKPGTIPSTYVRRGDWKLIRFHGDGTNRTDRFELYNLAEDIGESKDVSAANPELVKQLNAEIEDYLARTKAAVPIPNPAYVPKATVDSQIPTDTHGQRFIRVDDQPLVEWDFTAPETLGRWRAVGQVKLEPADGGALFVGTGPDPITQTRLPKPVESPVVIRLRCQAQQEALTQFFWAGPGDGYSGKRVIGQHIHKGTSFTTHEIWIEDSQTIDKLRFDPIAGQGRLLVESISIHPLKIHRSTTHPVLPKPTFRNSVHVVPIHEVFNAARYTDEKRRADIANLLDQCGPPRLYMRLGFSGSTPQLWNKGPVSEIIPLLNEHGLVWHSHHQVSIHNVGRHDVIMEALKKDRRNAAWRHDGSCGGGAKSWSDKKAFTSEGPGRASALLCVSRLNHDVIDARREAARWLNEDMQHASMVRKHPYVMVSAGHSVENEMAPSPFPWACYSPYSISEFQQWLRHTGIYDAETGAYAGQGAQASVVGELLRIKNTNRSQFYDDPSPNDANDTGVSFNHYFGTSFDTWKLEYWDFADFPPGSLAWNDDLSNALPQAGQRGNTSGVGFDAPRTPDADSRFWMAFDNEDISARGYRQHSVQVWNMDLGEDFAATGFPRQRLYSHQIPGEVLGPLVYPNETEKWAGRPHLLRRFTTASPSWTADDHRGHFGGFGAGITAFHEHAHDRDLFRRVSSYDRNWAILEYHPDGHVAEPDYDKCMRSLRMLWRYQVHVLAPGWWNYTEPPFVLQNSGFSRAIRDWFNNPSGFDESDQPWDSSELVDYRPPQVHGLRALRDGKAVEVSWSKRMWPDVPYAEWSLWREFAGGEFQVHRSETPHGKGEHIATVAGDKYAYTDTTAKQDMQYYYRVVAVRHKGVELYGDACTAIGIKD